MRETPQKQGCRGGCKRVHARAASVRAPGLGPPALLGRIAADPMLFHQAMQGEAIPKAQNARRLSLVTLGSESRSDVVRRRVDPPRRARLRATADGSGGPEEGWLRGSSLGGVIPVRWAPDIAFHKSASSCRVLAGNGWCNT